MRGILHIRTAVANVVQLQSEKVEFQLVCSLSFGRLARVVYVCSFDVVDFVLWRHRACRHNTAQKVAATFGTSTRKDLTTDA